MNVSLSSHFTYKKLLRFVIPSVVMMIFTSIYNVVDGIYVSNIVGTTQFAALNFIFPYVMILGAFGFMVGTGGSALVSKTMGEGRHQKANSIFSMLVCFTFIMGIILTIVGYVFLRPFAVFFGAEGEMLEYAVNYAWYLMPGILPLMFQGMFQTFMITAEKPHLGLGITVGAGITNIILDAILIGALGMGLKGAAIATTLGQVVGGILPLLYFIFPNKSRLKLVRPVFDGKALLKTLLNGSSEFVTNIALSIVAMIYNWKLLRLIGEDGVSAYGVYSYLSFIFVAVFLGYSIGVAPVIGFNYGAQNHEELKNVFGKSIRFIAVTSVSMTLISLIFAPQLAGIFASKDPELLKLSTTVLRISSLSYLLAGVNIFASAFFTALNNGLISATISFSRLLLFQVVTVTVLPLFMGVSGVWTAIVASELLALIVSGVFLITQRKRYRYI
ncbi:MAG: MATE family efflux transporter [Dehalococcoidales bacterium]|nr:MATE family efflux transporter [Dehalococcoidales bacterium]